LATQLLSIRQRIIAHHNARPRNGWVALVVLPKEANVHLGTSRNKTITGPMLCNDSNSWENDFFLGICSFMSMTMLHLICCYYLVVAFELHKWIFIFFKLILKWCQMNNVNKFCSKVFCLWFGNVKSHTTPYPRGTIYGLLKYMTLPK